MSVFGVKSSKAIEAAAQADGVATIGMFPVISRAENEIILGENDTHLNFKISILIRQNQSITKSYRNSDDGAREVVATTVVHCHGFLGKAYISIIKAFHVMIVKYNLARLQSRILGDGLLKNT